MAWVVSKSPTGPTTTVSIRRLCRTRQRDEPSSVEPEAALLSSVPPLARISVGIRLCRAAVLFCDRRHPEPSHLVCRDCATQSAGQAHADAVTAAAAAQRTRAGAAAGQNGD